jgi:hypothetical protein
MLAKPGRPAAGCRFRQPADIEVARIPSPLVDRPTPESDGERIGAKSCAAWFGPRDQTPNLFAGADLTGADLAGANLTGADLSAARLGGIIANNDTVWPEGFPDQVQPPPSF